LPPSKKLGAAWWRTWDEILIDECAPRALKTALVTGGYDCTTVQEAGWSGKDNGELLALADAVFDVLVTVDQKIRYQQNLTRRKIALVIVRARSNRLVDLQPHFPACIEALGSIQPGTVVEVGSPS
jgi:predicted nuclease of predicted toxin-antitoxin system